MLITWEAVAERWCSKFRSTLYLLSFESFRQFGFPSQRFDYERPRALECAAAPGVISQSSKQ